MTTRNKVASSRSKLEIWCIFLCFFLNAKTTFGHKKVGPNAAMPDTAAPWTMYDVSDEP